MRRTLSEFRRARALRVHGLGDRAISREIGVPYGTLRYWRKVGRPPRTVGAVVSRPWHPPEPIAYCYLLGLYLGDGCLGIAPSQSPQLRITLDAAYPAIIQE